MTKSGDKERRQARRERMREVARGIEKFREHIGSAEPFVLTPQALHHWNRNDQIDELAEAGQNEPDTGFMMRLLALCSLPRTNPGKQDRYVRKNGPFTLIMIAGGEVPKLPYGTGRHRFHELRRRGVSQFNAAVAAGSPTGFWRMSSHPVVQQALRNRYFDSVGLPRVAVSSNA